MPQELDLSLSDSAAKTVRASICKIAFKTIPRCGIASLILLCMGLYFLFSACQTFQQIQTEKNTPYELTATTDNSNIDLNTLMQIEGVERISPVVNLNATLSLEEYMLDCEIRGVYSNFLNLKFTQGTMYPDNSNMPYLILNEAAAKGFLYERQVRVVSVEEPIVINVNGIEKKAVVCGIFGDSNEEPVVYMSHEVARKEYGTGSQNKLLIILKNWIEAKRTVTLLKKQNIHSEYDYSIILSAESQQKECVRILCLSSSIIACSIILIQLNRKIEIRRNKSELKILLILGMTEQNVESIYLVRTIMIQIICLCCSVGYSIVMGIFTKTAVKLTCCFFVCWLTAEHIITKKRKFDSFLLY